MISLNRSLQIEPNYLGALKERAELRLAAADYQSAIADLKSALQIKPGDKEISLRLAHVYELSNRPDDAQRIYESIGYQKAAGESPERIGAINVIGTAEDFAYLCQNYLGMQYIRDPRAAAVAAILRVKNGMQPW